MSEHRVLIVDDEVEFANLLGERLQARGMTVDTVFSGEEALEIAEKKTFDAILLDLAMPGMNGIETLERLRAINPDLQIILFTGNATVDTTLAAMKLGAVDLLEKPANLEKVLSKIDAAGTRARELAEKHLDDQLTDILRRKGW